LADLQEVAGARPGLTTVAAPCFLCGEAAADPLWTTPDRAFAVPGIYTVARCRRCGFLYQKPRVADGHLADCYPDHYPRHQEPSPRIPFKGSPGRVKAARWALASALGIRGTDRFMAPEIVRGEALPSVKTDPYSLSVLLFYLLMVHHPLAGRRPITAGILGRERRSRCSATSRLSWTKLNGIVVPYTMNTADAIQRTSGSLVRVVSVNSPTRALDSTATPSAHRSRPD
jgi:serine/threonine protein kinase